MKPAPKLVEPTRLVRLPIAAYGAALALDEEAVYLLTAQRAYRFVDGEPAHAIQLDLGLGATLTRSAFVFWSKGGIWRSPKQGGVTRQIAAFPHQPQYFVASGEDVAWVDLSDAGLYTIQTLDGSKPRVLVSSTGEISALDMVGDAIYFVQRPSDDAWRIGVVRTHGGGAEYGAVKKGRRPAALSGSEQLYYYSLDSSEIRAVSLDLRREETTIGNLVCSPIHVSTAIYCGCVEGLFEVSRETHLPRILVYDRPGSITNIVSNSKWIAWTVDVGADALAVDMLRVPEGH